MGAKRHLLWTFIALTAWLSASLAADPPGTWLKVGAAAAELEADDGMVIGGGIGPGKAAGAEGKLRAVATVIEGPGGAKAAIQRRADQADSPNGQGLLTSYIHSSGPYPTSNRAS